MKNREERDSLGTVSVPRNAYYGAATQRAIGNFNVSGIKSDPGLVRAIVIIKKAAAQTNVRLKTLEPAAARAITKACDRILAGEFGDQFPIDVFQAGAGTSLNMNVNEVVANIANESLGFLPGSYKKIHPNDHVNMAQSTNDVIPAALRIAILKKLPMLLKALETAVYGFEKKGRAFAGIIKSGRTHLGDAMPVTLGSEFAAYGAALRKDTAAIKTASNGLFFTGIGGTAVGTGINSHPDYRMKIIAELSRLTGLKLKPSEDLQEAMQNTSDFLNLSGVFRTLAQNLIRIGNDLRLMSSGPGSGLAEISLPQVQPGSSIMPGKTNPSVIEMLTMVAFQVCGLDGAIFLSCQSGQLELNVFTPLIAYNLLAQTGILTRGLEIFNGKCLNGIKANMEMTDFWFNRSYGSAAILNPHTGYAKAAETVLRAKSEKKTVKETAIGEGLIDLKTAEFLFSGKNMLGPNLTSKKNEKRKKP